MTYQSLPNQSRAKTEIKQLVKQINQTQQPEKIDSNSHFFIIVVAEY